MITLNVLDAHHSSHIILYTCTISLSAIMTCNAIRRLWTRISLFQAMTCCRFAWLLSIGLWTKLSEISIYEFPFKKMYLGQVMGCDCLVTWFRYQIIATPGNKTAAPSWPDLIALLHVSAKLRPFCSFHNVLQHRLGYFGFHQGSRVLRVYFRLWILQRLNQYLWLSISYPVNMLATLCCRWTT